MFVAPSGQTRREHATGADRSERSRRERTERDEGLRYLKILSFATNQNVHLYSLLISTNEMCFDLYVLRKVFVRVYSGVEAV